MLIFFDKALMAQSHATYMAGGLGLYLLQIAKNAGREKMVLPWRQVISSLKGLNFIAAPDKEHLAMLCKLLKLTWLPIACC